MKLACMQDPEVADQQSAGPARFDGSARTCTGRPSRPAAFFPASLPTLHRCGKAPTRLPTSLSTLRGSRGGVELPWYRWCAAQPVKQRFMSCCSLPARSLSSCCTRCLLCGLAIGPVLPGHVLIPMRPGKRHAVLLLLLLSMLSVHSCSLPRCKTNNNACTVAGAHPEAHSDQCSDTRGDPLRALMRCGCSETLFCC